MNYMDGLLKEGQTEVYKIFKEMCDRVNAPYYVVNDGDKWFQKYNWHEIEQEDFTVWFTNYLYKNKEARMQIMSHPLKNKKLCRQTAEFFVFQYGWQVK